MLVIVRLAGEPSRLRVGVWRELRRVGAVPLAQGVWAMPATPVFTAAVAAAREVARRGDGELVCVEVTGRDEDSANALRAAFTAARAEEWAEFVADCDKFDAEIGKEIGKQKFTLAELEEEEQSLERLRRWYRDLKLRDVLELPQAREAEQRLKQCTEVLADYADQVYRAMHDPAQSGPADTNQG
ncbi:Chromate resistance protein ChrB [Nocardia tengchongensis]|uniref:Chromate resistance protein ChrB n=1 Tax=Nocardia tengchongensis TaxID=2055889 RepID=UPI00360C7ADB